MKTFKKQYLYISMIGLISLVASNSYAVGNSILEEVVVTAQKRQESAQDIGMSITALTGESLAKNSVLTTSDLSKVITGFVYTKTPRGTPVYSMRGIGFDDNSLGSSPTVSTYLDEVSMPYPVMTRFVAFDLERLEALKGPQGILFGQNSTGGAVNFIAAKPTEEFEAGIEASYGRFDTFETRAYISGALSDEFKVRVSGMSIQSGEGWQKSYTRNDELGEQDVFSGRIVAEWTPTEDLQLAFTLHGWTDKSDTQASQLLDVAPAIPATVIPTYDAYPRVPNNDAQAADWDANSLNPLERDDNFIQQSLRVDYILTDVVTLTSITSYSDYEQDFTQDTDGANFRDFTLSNTGSIESFSQELRLSGESADINWIVGLNYTKDKTEDNTLYDVTNNSVNLGFLGLASALSTAKQDVENRAVFGNIAWAAADAVTINAGIRYTEDERTYSGCTRDSDGTGQFAFNTLLDVIFGVQNNIQLGGCFTSVNGVAGIVNRKLEEDNFSWRLGVDWQVNNDLMTYANISKGYKSGSIPALNTSSAFQIQPVTQESVLAYEIGLKSTLLDQRMRVNAAAFYYDYEDKQLRGRILDPIGVFGIIETLLNIPKSEVYGAEVGVDLVPADGLTLGLNIAYTKTEVTDDFFAYGPVGNEFNYNGQSFPHTPELHVTASVNYDFDITDTLNGFVGVNALYQDETTGLFNDPDLVGTTEISPVLRPGVTADRDTFKVDSYTTVDARLGIEGADSDWKVWLWGRNITDEYYWNNATQSLDPLYRLSAMPRTYGAAVSFKF